MSLNPPSTFHGLLRLAELYINLEDAKRLKKDEHIPVPVGRKPGMRDEHWGPESHRSRPGRAHGGFAPSYDNYTPLVRPVSQILMAIQKHPSLRWPPTKNIPPPSCPNQGEYCKFHHNFGHTTDDYMELKDEIERLHELDTRDQVTMKSGHIRDRAPKVLAQKGLPSTRENDT